MSKRTTLPQSSTMDDQRAEPAARQLFLVRCLWLLSAPVLLALTCFFLPLQVSLVQTVCTSDNCSFYQPNPGTLHNLAQLGLSLNAATVIIVSIIGACALTWFVIAVIIAWKNFSNWFALSVSLLALIQTAMAARPPDLLPSQATATPWLWVVIAILLALDETIYVIVGTLFPNGRLTPRWTRLILLSWLVIGLPCDLLSNLPSPLPLAWQNWLGIVSSYCWLLCIAAIIVAQIYRYRRLYRPVERQQTKWVLFFGGIALLEQATGESLSLIFPALFAPGSLYSLLYYPITKLFLTLLGLSLLVAMLRYRLWDIDLIISRTLAYGTLTACVVALYVLVVVGLGALLQTRGNLLISLLATALIAVLFQPLHTRLQRAVNRLLYGERDEPYKVISLLGQRLEATLAPEAVLPTIVETVTQALRLPYAAISLKQDGEDVITASSGRAADDLTRLPLLYQSEHIGDLLLAPRARGEFFSSADQTLLADLARQAGIAIHTVRLTTDLQRLTKELQLSRTHLVTAREEERRRLRRDLHDGLGSVLASLNWRAGALRMVLFRDPVAADALVVEQQKTIQAAIGDIRRLVYDLRPPALDELGLMGAIRERAAKQSAPTERDSILGLRVDVVAPDHLPALSAAVEVAAYRIVQEALANVMRHAQAHRCCICLSCENDLLHVEVTDDGIGLPESYRAGIGLLSMRERAAELGGTCEIEPMPEGGTCVRARLPLLKYD